MLGYTIVGTVLYVQQADIASQIADRGLRTAFFGGIDSAVAVLTIVTQVFLTGRFIKWVGVAVALTFLPLICIIGFAALGFWPAAVVIVVFQVLRRAANFAIARPAKETLFTVVTREDRFKAKPFIDTAVYRAGDQVGVWSEWFLGRIGFGVAGVAFIMIPIAGLWLMVGYWLGLQQTARLERDRAAEAAAAEAAPA
jgi:AAA family ATP:ADP antiporter